MVVTHENVSAFHTKACLRCTLGNPSNVFRRLDNSFDQDWDCARGARGLPRDHVSICDSIQQLLKQIERSNLPPFVGLGADLDVERLSVAMQNEFDRASVGRMRRHAHGPKVHRLLKCDLRTVAMLLRPRIKPSGPGVER